MPDTIKILLIEDDKDQITLYEDAKVEHNDDSNNLNIEYIQPTSYDDVLKLFKEDLYDAAIIDLNLSEWGPDLETKGKEIIPLIREFARYPVFIVSGSIDEDISNLTAQNKFIESYDRDAIETNDLLLEIQSLHKTGITKILGSKGLIEKHLNDIFWNHFAQSKEYWLNHHLSGNPDLEKIVSRYTLTHLYEYLDSTSDEQKYDITEMYIRPVIKDGLLPGSIITHEGKTYLIMSPACDLAQGTCDYLTLLELILFFEHPTLLEKKTSFLQKQTELNASTETGKAYTSLESQVKNARGTVNSIIQTFVENKKGRYYFLPKFLTFEAHLVDFQNIRTVSITDIVLEQRIMSISVHFLKDIQAKFSSYYARQGSPDFNFDEISKQYTEEFLE